MSTTLQEYFAAATEKAAAALETAFLRLPEDKRAWVPMGEARTALDQVAECALINGFTTQTLKHRTFSMGGDYSDFQRTKALLAQDWNALRALLYENTAQVAAAIKSVPDEDLGVEIPMPWGPMTLLKIIANVSGNMTYHEGQINYIASMLGCLS